MRSNAKEVFKRISLKLEKAKREAPKILANEGQKHFNKTFASQKTDNGYVWPEVKRREPGTFEYKYPKKKYLSRRTNPILIGKTRRLKNALNRSVKSANTTRIIWAIMGSVGKYAYYHNYGIGQKRRSFMRDSPKLRKALKDKYAQIFRSNIR